MHVGRFSKYALQLRAQEKLMDRLKKGIGFGETGSVALAIISVFAYKSDCWYAKKDDEYERHRKSSSQIPDHLVWRFSRRLV